MNDRQLRYALSVWRERSFSKAAEKLGISQPAISEQVRLLEDEVGFPLFRRTGRGVEATYQGRNFLDHAEHAVSGLLELADTARQLRGGPVGSFAVGCSSGIAQTMIPRVMESLAPVLPCIRLEVVTAPTRRIQRLVYQERLDVGLTVEAGPRSLPPNLKRERFAEDEMALLVAPGHRLARSSEAVDVAALVDERLVLNEPAIGYGEFVQSMFAARGLRPSVTAISDDVETIKLMVRAGAGIAIVPRSCAANEIALGQLAIIGIRPRHAAAITLIRRMTPLEDDAESYVSMIRDALTGEPANTERRALAHRR